MHATLIMTVFLSFWIPQMVYVIINTKFLSSNEDIFYYTPGWFEET